MTEGDRVRIVGTHFTNHGQLGTVESLDADGQYNEMGAPIPQWARVIVDGGGEGAWVYPVACVEVTT